MEEDDEDADLFSSYGFGRGGLESVDILVQFVLNEKCGANNDTKNKLHTSSSV